MPPSAGLNRGGVGGISRHRIASTGAVANLTVGARRHPDLISLTVWIKVMGVAVMGFFRGDVANKIYPMMRWPIAPSVVMLGDRPDLIIRIACGFNLIYRIK